MSAAPKILAALSGDSAAASLSGWVAFPVESRYDDGSVVVKQIGMMDGPVNEVKTAWFGNYGWVTFAGGREDAVTEAIASKSRATPAVATESTLWILLRVSLTPQQVTKCFKEDLLAHANQHGLACWRFYGDIPLSLVDHDWAVMCIDKMGMHSWANIAVGARTFGNAICDRGSCQNCSETNVPTWSGWCAVCWNADHVQKHET